MVVEQTKLKDCFLIKPNVFKDKRGLFFESYHKKRFHQETGLNIDFVQDNHSVSQYGSLRGLHLQIGDKAQAKLVRVVAGEVYDVVVDLRKDSPTFKQAHGVFLNDKNNYQLFIPKGFAHGFVTLSKTAVFNYKCDEYYDKTSEAGVIYNDPELNIDWQIDKDYIILSEKDKALPTLEAFLK
ncbi:dTDP-4-dehydrorhamnose 3,5-epimerase [Mesonia sp. K7]|uniref:dTDP-4-dehydrorhamnose 3,5-epimerase n=1 Tax=Mesonia sp. K7 TaxID=2218606 RepID=UPI000DA98EDF|nr:dTDP-4-dehydrorhamnose 3,5-epimerase [Mesonia sp. K7]PZD79116.1 dTDP-4-dehydrorhamnose 3,5-epimerase [Mesonia sp. K7]